ncbi:MAG: hypothetical protein GXP55_16900 [Deltaproteobacteria bacterium]|nr:hypothetical protein [Deltaproteobacteria bacterium]
MFNLLRSTLALDSRLLAACALSSALALTLAGCGDDSTPMDSGVDDGGVRGDETFEGTCISPPLCDATQTESACNCVSTPRTEADFTTNRVGCAQLTASGEATRNPTDDFCDASANDGSPDLSCFDPAGYFTKEPEETVTVYGVVDVFGNGGDADNITIEIYDGTNTDGTLGELLGSATASIADPCTETENEVENDMVTGTRKLGFYFIPGIPSDRPLIIKQTGALDFWKTIYSYNQMAINTELERGAPAADACATMSNAAFDGVPRWRYRARIISTSDWTSIPLTAGLVSGIRAGSGVVAGEVHDCTDTRLEFAQVATNPAPEVLAYFNDNPDNPLPVASRFEGTSLLGLYAALDIPEGPVDVTSLGRVNGELVSLGWYRVRVFAGAITSVTLRGLRAQQTGASATP